MSAMNPDNSHGSASSATAFRDARTSLLRWRDDYDTAYREFRWPVLTQFNWALDWFDTLAQDPATSSQAALWITDASGTDTRLSFADLAARSNQVANWLSQLGVNRGDRLILMLDNQVELWEMLLAGIKLGAVLIPASTLLTAADLHDRVHRGHARHVVTSIQNVATFAGVPGAFNRICVGGTAEGWLDYSDSSAAPHAFTPHGVTRATDPLLLYFTSGTTAQPKLVEHTHASYPVGHLSTMYWIGLEPGDIHLNISSPGWAKHAWSNVFAPWNAGATVLIHSYERFDAADLLAVMGRCGVTSFCAPPTVWRMLIQSDLSALAQPPRKVVGAGEPLNPEVIARVEQAWGVTIRDGFGQTETTVAIANTPGQPIKPGSMGRPVPGYTIALVDPVTAEVGDEGEICLDLSRRPLGLMVGYRGDDELSVDAMRGGYYHTGDVASRDSDGYVTYVGRADDVFKASDYRISPFELESALLQHDAVAEAAVVPSPDPVRLAVPKAFIVLAPGHSPSRETALSILRYSRDNLAPYKRIRRLEFSDLPKTISGKIRRVELRAREQQRTSRADASVEYREEDFDELHG
jgi:acetyl-CoA synthetase